MSKSNRFSGILDASRAKGDDEPGEETSPQEAPKKRQGKGRKNLKS